MRLSRNKYAQRAWRQMFMNIENLRAQIDEIDKKIVRLLNQRCRIVAEIGKTKMKGDRKIYVPEREKFVLDRLDKMNKDGQLPSKALRAIYREIMSASIALEKPLQIAYFGQKASFTHLAAYSKFGHAVEYAAKTAISDVFNDVDAERYDYGVVPIENSTEGVVNHTLDMLINSSVKICAEINMRIHQNLLSRYSMKNIKKIYGHSQCFGQCRIWLQENLPGAENIEVSSTTKAAELASREKYSAAIASIMAAKIYGLKVLADKIEDNPYNTTRFLVIGKQEPKATGDDKTSICYAVKDRVGALYDSLVPFKKNGITLTMIESRPSRRKNWEYYFFVDLKGHVSETDLSKAITELGDFCQFVKILGSYPQSKEVI